MFTSLYGADCQCVCIFVFLNMWGPISFTAMLLFIFFRSEHIFSNSNAAHSIVRAADVCMLQISTASTTTQVLDHLSVCLPSTYPCDISHISGQRPRHSSPQLLPPAPRREIPKLAQTIREISSSPVPQVFSPMDVTETPPREASRRYPDQVPRTSPKGSSPCFELLSDVWAPHPLSEAEFVPVVITPKIMMIDDSISFNYSAKYIVYSVEKKTVIYLFS